MNDSSSNSCVSGCVCACAQETSAVASGAALSATHNSTSDAKTAGQGSTELSETLPNLLSDSFDVPAVERFSAIGQSSHPPRVLLLYGSLRERSFSRLLVQEAQRLLQAMGADARIFDPAGLPLVDGAPATHPKVQALREAVQWSEAMVWCSPERHGAMTGILKTQIDWIPLSEGAVRPTQGKTLAVMQVSGGSQSFNAVNQMRVLGRWMRMITIPNQSSVPKAYQEFDEHDRMRPSAYYDRVVDVMEELVKFTLLTRDVSPYLVSRYSERKEDAQKRQITEQITNQAADQVAAQTAHAASTAPLAIKDVVGPRATVDLGSM